MSVNFHYLRRIASVSVGCSIVYKRYTTQEMIGNS